LDITISDILDNLDDIEFALMGHIEAAKGPFAFYIDGFYMNVEGTQNGPNSSLEANTQQSAIELVGALQLAEFALDKQVPKRSQVVVEALVAEDVDFHRNRKCGSSRSHISVVGPARDGTPG
jgi:hypothetical protein